MTQNIPDAIYNKLSNEFGSILNCHFCHSVLAKECILFLSPSSTSMNQLPPLSVAILQCTCSRETNYYYLCLCCYVASSQSKINRKNSRRMELWLRNHHSECQSNNNDDNAGNSDDDGDGGFFPSAASENSSSNNSAPKCSNSPLANDGIIIAPPYYPLPTVDWDGMLLMNEQQKKFYQLEHETPGLGFASIVRGALKTSAPAHELDTEEVAFHLDVCSLCVDLTRSQLRSVGTMLEQVVDYYRSIITSSRRNQKVDFDTLIETTQLELKDANVALLSTYQITLMRKSFMSLQSTKSTSDDTNNTTGSQRGMFKETKPGVTYDDMERIYLKSSTAIFRNMPVPQVYLTEDCSHAYISLTECVAGFIASGVCDLSVPSTSEFDSNAVESYYTSNIARQIYGETVELGRLCGLNGQVFSLHFKDWADDATKGNATRGSKTSYNIRTITFLKTYGNGNIDHWSFTISIGKKGPIHSSVESIFNEDLKALSKPNLYYSGHHKQAFWAVCNLVAGVRDRPARGETFCIGNQGHNWAKRWRYAAFHGTNQPFMPCLDCAKKRLSRLRKTQYTPSQQQECIFCADLDYSSRLLEVEATSLKKDDWEYPTTFLPGTPPIPVERPIGPSTMLRPVALTFRFLKEATLVAFFNYHSSVHMTYRRRLATTAQERREIGNVGGWKVKNFKAYLKSAGLNDYLLKNLQKFSDLNKHIPATDLLTRFESEVVPATWQRTGCELSHQLDAVFHLIFHGISITIWEILLKSMATNFHIGRNRSVKSTFRPVINLVLTALKELSLYNLQVLPFAEGTDGFSTNGWVGSNKLALCMVMPYIMSHMTYFLRVELNENPSTDSKEKILHMQLATVSFHCLCVLLLQRTVTKLQCSMIGDYTKTFLFEITQVQKTYTECTAELSYLTTGNFLSALNLEDNVRSHGPLRNFYDALDEKNVQKVKRAHPHINESSPTWRKSLLAMVTREQYLDLLWRSKNNNIETGNDDNKELTPRELHMNVCVMDGNNNSLQDDYGGIHTLPFSGLYNTENKNCYVVVRKGGRRVGKLFTRWVQISETGRWRGGCWYYAYKITNLEEDLEATDLRICKKIEKNYHPVVFLPFQWLEHDTITKKKKHPMITIISIDVHKVYRDGMLVLPSLSTSRGDDTMDDDGSLRDDSVVVDELGMISI